MQKHTKILQIFIILVISLALNACSNSKNEVMNDSDGDNYASQRKNNKFLAYTHSLTVETTELQIEKKYKATIKACTEATEYKCIIIDTSLETGEYTSGHIKLRVEPNGVNDIIKASATQGEISKKSTQVEDLAKPIIDNNKRSTMLETHRDRLIELQKRPDNDIDSLIKISSELAKIHSELEQSLGETAHLQEKIELDLVKIYFNVDRHKSFWKPISTSLKNFTGYLSKGISEAIWAIGYFSPWLLVTIGTLLFCRFIWRKTSRKK